VAFGIQDFRDLVQLLGQHPEWREELRRLVLTEELLGLPALVRDLAEAQRRTEERLDTLAAIQQRMDDRLGGVQGWQLEHRYRDRAGAYFGGLLRRIRPLSSWEVADVLDDAEATGQLSSDERRDAVLADLVVRGRRREDQSELYLVVEVSVGIRPDDVECAVRRAEVLGRLYTTIPVVAGEGITPEAMALADSRGVWRVLDRRVLAPDAR
jgi:hypothetical protein